MWFTFSKGQAPKEDLDKIEFIDIRTMEAAVEDYIYKKTGKTVTIDIQAKARNMSLFDGIHYLQKQYDKLNLAYNIAKANL